MLPASSAARSPRAKKIVLGVLDSQLVKQQARCVGFVIMPDHVHAIVWFPEPNQLSRFMKQWKQRSSYSIKQLLRSELEEYGRWFPSGDPVWQRKYDAFQIYSGRKIEEKLVYMHATPLRAGLALHTVDWPWSSARWYGQRRTVGVPIEWIE